MKVSIAIRAFSVTVTAAIGGSQGVLVGQDVLGPMFDEGYKVAGLHGV